VPTVIVAVLAGWVVVVALRARRLARPHAGEPSFSVLADGRLPAVVTVVLGTLAVAEVSAALSRLL
jgi:putative membrane protein